MPHLYRDKCSNPTAQAQENLRGRTHYVDPDTLRFHKSRVLSAHVVYNGLLFAIVTSEPAGAPELRRGRGFRYTIFDVFGTVIDRQSVNDMYSSRNAATKAMWKALNSMDAPAITRAGAASASRYFALDLERLAADVSAIEESSHAAQ